MSETPPLMFRYRAEDGSLHLLHPRFREHFEDGELYRLVAFNERSMKTHRHFFAVLNDTFQNLPEDEAVLHERHPNIPRGMMIEGAWHEGGFPSVEHLRAWALIECGYSQDKTMVLESPGAARRTMLLARDLDAYCRIARVGCVIKIRKAQSITELRKAQDFQAMKEKVLPLLASLIDVKRSELNNNAGRAA